MYIIAYKLLMLAFWHLLGVCVYLFVCVLLPRVSNSSDVTAKTLLSWLKSGGQRKAAHKGQHFAN